MSIDFHGSAMIICSIILEDHIFDEESVHGIRLTGGLHDHSLPDSFLLYRGYNGIMEKKLETTIMENQMEKNTENEMETGIM